MIRYVATNKANNRVIEDMSINGNTPETLYQQLLPDGSTSIRTILYYNNITNICDTFALHIQSKLNCNVLTAESLLSKGENVDVMDQISATELESHTDSPVVGKYCKVLRWHEEKARVSGFSDS